MVPFKPASKSSVTSSRGPAGKKLPAEVRVESPRAARPAAPKMGSKPNVKEVQVGHSLRAEQPETIEVGGRKRKAVGGDGAENEGAASMPWDLEEVEVGGGGARKKQRLSEGEGSEKKSKSVAFKSRSQLEVRS